MSNISTLNDILDVLERIAVCMEREESRRSLAEERGLDIEARLGLGVSNTIRRDNGMPELTLEQYKAGDR